MNADKNEEKNEIADICQRITMVRQSCFGPRGKAQFARELDISPSTYDYYESKRIPPVDILLRISDLAGIDVRWLLTGKKEFADANVTLHPLAKRLDALLEKSPQCGDSVKAFLDAVELLSGDGGNSAFSSAGKSDSAGAVREYIEVDLADVGGNMASAGQPQLQSGNAKPIENQGGAISGSLVAGFVSLSDKEEGRGAATDSSRQLLQQQGDSSTAVGEHQGWIPVLGRSAAGVPHFWADVQGGDDSSVKSVTMLEDLVAAMKPRRARQARQAMAEGDLAPSGGAQIVLLDAPESPGTAEFIIAEHISNRYNDLFALRIDGESMEPEICHGDVVIVSPNCPAEPGSAAIVQLENQIGVTCKLIRYDGDRVHLIPVNESFAPSVHAASSVRWALKVIAFVHSV